MSSLDIPADVIKRQHWNGLLELPRNPYDLFLGVLVARNEICGFKVTNIDLISKNVGEY